MIKRTLIKAPFCTDNKIDGIAFSELSEDEVKAIVKPLGVVKKIIRLQKSAIVSVTIDNVMHNYYPKIRTGLYAFTWFHNSVWCIDL